MCSSGADASAKSEYTSSSFMHLIVQAMGVHPELWDPGFEVLRGIAPAATAQQWHEFLAKDAHVLLQLVWALIQHEHQRGGVIQYTNEELLTSFTSLFRCRVDYRSASQGGLALDKEAALLLSVVDTTAAELLYAANPPLVLSILDALVRADPTWGSVNLVLQLLNS
eukprot:jgi/Chrzof1/8639/Cz03g18160.t1